MSAHRIRHEDLPRQIVLRLPAIVSSIEDLCWTDARHERNFVGTRDNVAAILFHLFNGVCVREDYQIGLRHAVATVVTDYFSGIEFKDSVGLEKSLMQIGLSIVAELDIRHAYIDGFFPYTANTLVSERGDLSFNLVSRGVYHQVLGHQGI